jgi:hypothetical protein
VRFILISFCSVKQFYGLSFVTRKRILGSAARAALARIPGFAQDELEAGAGWIQVYHD